MNGVDGGLRSGVLDRDHGCRVERRAGGRQGRGALLKVEGPGFAQMRVDEGADFLLEAFAGEALGIASAVFRGDARALGLELADGGDERGGAAGGAGEGDWAYSSIRC